MNLVVERRPTVQRTTFGRLTLDGVFQCYTLEDVIRERPGVPVSEWKVPGETAIPSGQYEVVAVTSPKFGPNTLTLLDVPGFTHIRIHAGNDDADTHGCLLVGNRIVEQADDGGNLLDSSKALAALKAKVLPALKAGETVTVEIRNP